MIRVFTRKTTWSPQDDDAWYSAPEIMWGGNGQPVNVSCTFTYDKDRAEHLAEQWKLAGYDVLLGGPAYDDAGGVFIPGQYLKHGAVITSRGCNNHCWFCCVPPREGPIRELYITEGWNLMDNNLLQCSEAHIRAVFAMLARQKHKALFSGGLEVAILKDWHVELLVNLKPERFYFAYDAPADYAPLVEAAKKVRKAGFKYQTVGVYVLVGYPKDTQEAAEQRCQSVCRLGLKPMAMLYRNQQGITERRWRQFQREWANHTIVGAKMKQYRQTACQNAPRSPGRLL